MKPIIIYSDSLSNRLTYALDVIFKHVLFVDYILVTKKVFLKDSNDVKINYSKESLEDAIQITPHQILSETNLQEYSPEVSYFKDIAYIFKTSSDNQINYDLFASVFYMVSRYEEYFKTDLDTHGRFKAENSLAFKNDFLEKPIVNIWIKKLQTLIETKYPDYKFPKKEYQYINSIDIDVAYSYKGKSKGLLASSFIKNLIQGNTDEIKKKLAYILKKIEDPYDTYTVFKKINKKYKKTNLFFIQVGNYGKFDKNLHHKSPKFKNLIKELHQENQIGLHPSYISNKHPHLIGVEKKRLEDVLGEKTTKSRQHFLKLYFPETYENLIHEGIEHDYTMGYASKIGFRAGICNPFPFFNLKTNEQTNLMLHPFQIMDGTLNGYMQLTPEEALAKSKKIINNVKAVRGTFISLWHNSSLTEENEWKNWKRIYTELVDFAQ